MSDAVNPNLNTEGRISDMAAAAAEALDGSSSPQAPETSPVRSHKIPLHKIGLDKILQLRSTTSEKISNEEFRVAQRLQFQGHRQALKELNDLPKTPENTKKFSYHLDGMVEAGKNAGISAEILEGLVTRSMQQYYQGLLG